jgi:endonuclease YncB( thermonuclease family)
MTGHRVKLLVAAALLVSSCSAVGESLEGRVVHVQDGDTLTVLVVKVQVKEQVKVRLVEIDAPESRQAFGNRSRESLAAMCAGKTARVEWTTKDRFKRTLGRVWCDGIDANAEQVKRGMAWVFDRYVTDQSLYQVQDGARSAKLGLWADASPTPPWEWRRQQREEAKASKSASPGK